MLRYKGFSLIKPNETQSEKISQIIDNFNGSIFHEVELNKIVQYNFNSDLFFLVDNPENIKCLAPVHISKNKLGLKRYLLSPMGDIPYAGFVGELRIDVKQLKVGLLESIKYTGFPYIQDTIHDDIVSEFGETNMVDLSLEEDEIFNSVIHSKRRNMIRKASKVGITIKTYFSQDGLKEFWPILEGLHKKLGYTSLTFDYYNKLFQNYVEKKQAFVSIAFKDNTPISGILVLGNKNYMHYYKGASLFGIKNEGHGELLQWEAIKTCISLGVKYYDLCNLDKEKLPAIYRFKTGISQNIIKYRKHTLNNLGYKILNKI